MKNIFYGFLLVFLSFDFTIGRSTINLIPDFIGYILIIKGIDQLISESDNFSKSRSLAQGMAIYSGIIFLMDLLGITGSLGNLAIILGIISTIVSLYITYNLIAGVKDIEKNHGTALNGNELYSLWKVMAVLQGISYITLIIPILSIPAIIANLVINIIFLLKFYGAANQYEHSF